MRCGVGLTLSAVVGFCCSGWRHKGIHVWHALTKNMIAGCLAVTWLLAMGALAGEEERKTGDTCSTAFPLAGTLPISVSGTTVGFSNNYDEACPYGESTAPDVVYRFTPASNVTVDVLLCNGMTDFDTKLYVYDSCPPTMGQPVACSDDACTSDAGQGFVSALWNLTLQAGITYYIVVDGYGNEAGDYTLTVRESLPPPICPSDGTTVYGQTPGLENWTLAFTDYDAGSWPQGVRYDNFCGVEGRIVGVRFWGLRFHFQYTPPYGGPGYWEQCSEDPMDVDIELYEDVGGLPGDEVFGYSLTIPGALVGNVGYSQYDVYEYSAALDVPLSLRNGWVSIVGGGAPDCWFAWMSSAEGDARSLSLTNGPGDPWVEWGFDLAFCLTTDNIPIYGACCDDCAGCRENVAFSECTGRFSELGCAALDPPCGAPLGACCHADGTCQVTTCSACDVLPPPCLGDLNCDGQVDLGDINPFVLYLTSMTAWEAAYAGCNPENGDINADGTYGQASFGDINPFVALLSEHSPPIPCPGPSATWLGPGSACLECPPRMIFAPDGLPYTDVNTTCGRGNSYDATCLGSFDGGEDILYTLVVSDAAQDLEIKLILDPNDAHYTGLLLTDHFPPDVNCIALSTNPAATPHSLGCQHLEAGTYYIMIDTWPAPACIPHFQLSVTACVPPTGRCCYADWTQCADVTQAECAALVGVWDEALDCTTPCPPHFREDCAHAEVISALPFVQVFYNDAMTADGPTGACDKYRPIGSMQNDAWFAWTADVSGLAVATAVGTYDAILEVWDDCGASTALHCADNEENGETEVVRFPAVTGATYYFQVGTTGNHPGGGWTWFDLHVAPVSGACCLPSGPCQVMEAAECIFQGGAYQGQDTACADVECPTAPGSDCVNPIQLHLEPTALPYLETNWTTGRGNDYWSTCLGSYDSGDDIVYLLVVTQTVVVNITLDPMGTSYTGIALADHCPPSKCIAKSINAGSAPHGLRYVVLVPGLYTLLIDKWLAPGDIPGFELLIENADTDLGACCVGSECVGSVELAECLNLGGTWRRGEPCASETCQTEDGDTCLDPLVVELSPDPYYSWEDWNGTYYRANTYAGTTCLGLYDGGREIIYKLVVSDGDVCVNIRLLSDDGLEPRMALSGACPPVEPCLIMPEYWYGVPVFHDLVLSPGVYYLMIDTWPSGPNPGYVVDWVSFNLWITNCDWGW